MYYFDPLSDDQLFSEEDLRRYRIVPYQPDLHISAVWQEVQLVGNGLWSPKEESDHEER